MTTIGEVDQTQLNEVLLAEDRAVLIDFWSQWCAPCLRLRPHLEKLADTYSDRVRMVAIDVEKHESAKDAYDVMSLPTLLLMKGGDTVHRFVGPTLPSTVEEHLLAL